MGLNGIKPNPPPFTAYSCTPIASHALTPPSPAFPLFTTCSSSWKLIYSSAGADGRVARGSDQLKSIEDISYVSENCRLSHTDTGSLRVYKRVTAPPRVAAAATAAASRAAGGDDTASALMGGGAGGGPGKAGRAAATAAGRGVGKQPLRRRMFFGWRRR